MRRFANMLCAVFLILLAAVPANAQQYERFRLPEGTRVVYQGETYQGFNLGEYRELLHMDADLRHLTEVVATQELRITELTIAVTSLQRALASAEESIEILQAERERLTVLWTEENRLRHLAEQRPDWNWIPWTLSAALAVVVVILSVVVGVGG